jgi:hypothetical protein
MMFSRSFFVRDLNRFVAPVEVTHCTYGARGRVDCPFIRKMDANEVTAEFPADYISSSAETIRSVM